MKALRRDAFMTVSVLLMLLVAATVVWRTGATNTVVPAGDDVFQTAPGGANEQFEFPAGFFTTGGGAVPSEAVPLTSITFSADGAVPGFNGDTVVSRLNDASTAGGSTRLALKGLRLISDSQLPVTFVDGSTALYTIRIREGSLSGGTMSFFSDGSFVSSLGIVPVLIFTSDTADARTTNVQTRLDGDGNYALQPHLVLKFRKHVGPHPDIAQAPPMHDVIIGPIDGVDNDFTIEGSANR